MGSMFAKLQRNKEEKEETTVYLRDLTLVDDDRYFICIEDGAMIACGMMDDILTAILNSLHLGLDF